MLPIKNVLIRSSPHSKLTKDAFANIFLQNLSRNLKRIFRKMQQSERKFQEVSKMDEKRMETIEWKISFRFKANFRFNRIF